MAVDWARPVVRWEIEARGTITLEPLDIPGGPTIAGITDPEGNPVSLVQQ